VFKPGFKGLINGRDSYYGLFDLVCLLELGTDTAQPAELGDILVTGFTLRALMVDST